MALLYNKHIEPTTPETESAEPIAEPTAWSMDSPTVSTLNVSNTNKLSPGNLTNWSNKQLDSFKDNWETSFSGKTLLRSYWDQIGWSGIPKNEGFESDVPWSAAYVSNSVMALMDSDKDNLKNFRLSDSHDKYITDAFNTSSTNQYDLYKATPLSSGGENTRFEVGDILFRGRGESTKGWGYDDFKNAAKDGKSYASHTDIIVDKGEDSKGSYYIISGGNRSGDKNYRKAHGLSVNDGGTVRNTKVYYNKESGKIQGDSYKGGMKINEKYRQSDGPSQEYTKPSTLDFPKSGFTKEDRSKERDNSEVVKYRKANNPNSMANTLRSGLEMEAQRRGIIYK